MIHTVNRIIVDIIVKIPFIATKKLSILVNFYLPYALHALHALQSEAPADLVDKLNTLIWLIWSHNLRFAMLRFIFSRFCFGAFMIMSL